MGYGLASYACSWRGPKNALATLPGVFEFRKTKTDRNTVQGGFGISYDVTFQNLTILQLPPPFQVEQNEASPELEPMPQSSAEF